MINPRCEKGQLLLISFIIMSALIVIVSAFTFMITNKARSFSYQVTDEKSFWLAEAGIQKKIYQLLNNNASDISTTAFGGGQYEVDVRRDDPINNPDIYTLTSTGWISYPDQKKIEVTLKVLTKFSNPRGLCAESDITLSGQGEIDSYDSSIGPYGGSNLGGEAEIGSNADIDLSGQAVVKGNAELGGTISLSGQSQVIGDVTSGEAISGQSHITGDITDYADPPPQPFDEGLIALVNDEVSYWSAHHDNNLISPAYLKQGTEFSLTGQDVYTLTAGNYYFTKFDISGQGRLIITGEVRIYYDGSSNINLAGQGVINSSDNVANFSIISRSSSDISLSGQADFAGFIFAPNAEVTYGGQADFFGGAVAREVHIPGQGDFHCDLNIDAGPGTQSITGIEQISWHDGS